MLLAVKLVIVDWCVSIRLLLRSVLQPITWQFNWPIRSITRDINTIHWLHNITMNLKMTTAQVVEASVTVTNSSFQNYTHPDDHTTRTTDTPGFKPFTIVCIRHAQWSWENRGQLIGRTLSKSWTLLSGPESGLDCLMAIMFCVLFRTTKQKASCLQGSFAGFDGSISSSWRGIHKYSFCCVYPLSHMERDSMGLVRSQTFYFLKWSSSAWMNIKTTGD